MKYFDGMGKDVTLYVETLEKENATNVEKIEFLSSTSMEILIEKNRVLTSKLASCNRKVKKLENQVDAAKAEIADLKVKIEELETVEPVEEPEKVVESLEPDGVIVNL